MTGIMPVTMPVLIKNETNPINHSKLADLFLITQNFTESIVSYNKVLALDKDTSNHHIYYNNLGEVYYLQGKASQMIYQPCSLD